MPEIGTSGLMSGDGKRGVGHRPQATAPILDSTKADICPLHYCCRGRALATSCAQSMNRRVTGLSVRAFNEMAPIGRRVVGKLMGKTLNAGLSKLKRITEP